MSILNRKCGLLVRMVVMQKRWWLPAATSKSHGQPGRWLATGMVYLTNDHALANDEYDSVEMSTGLNARKTKERYLSPEKRIADIINRRIAVIQEAAQINDSDASQIATLFSPIFTFDYQAIQMIRLLSAYNCDIKSILTQQPTVLGLNAEQVYMSNIIRIECRCLLQLC